MVVFAYCVDLLHVYTRTAIMVRKMKIINASCLRPSEKEKVGTTFCENKAMTDAAHQFLPPLERVAIWRFFRTVGVGGGGCLVCSGSWLQNSGRVRPLWLY